MKESNEDAVNRLMEICHILCPKIVPSGKVEWIWMGKKKREHVVFDGMRKQKKSIPFDKINKECIRNKKKPAKGATAKGAVDGK